MLVIVVEGFLNNYFFFLFIIIFDKCVYLSVSLKIFLIFFQNLMSFVLMIILRNVLFVLVRRVRLVLEKHVILIIYCDLVRHFLMGVNLVRCRCCLIRIFYLYAIAKYQTFAKLCVNAFVLKRIVLTVH